MIHIKCENENGVLKERRGEGEKERGKEKREKKGCGRKKKRVKIHLF